MERMNCHSSTKYDEIMSFIEAHKGKKCYFHYEIKGYDRWGNDNFMDFVLDDKAIKWIKEYMGTKQEYRNTNNAYVHNIIIY